MAEPGRHPVGTECINNVRRTNLVSHRVEIEPETFSDFRYFVYGPFERFHLILAQGASPLQREIVCSIAICMGRGRLICSFWVTGLFISTRAVRQRNADPNRNYPTAAGKSPLNRLRI